MKNIIFVLVCLLSLNLNAQSKKDQITNLNNKLDSLTHIIVNERQDFEKKIDEKSIEITAVKNQNDQLQSKNENLNTQITQEVEKILILEKRLSFVSDSVDILKHQIDALNIKISSKPSISIPTIKIGDQEWMTEDINTIIYNNGDAIAEAKTESQWEINGDKKEGCYRMLSNGTYVYNGYAINDERGLVPSGFIIPKFDQFNQLMSFLGDGDSREGVATKSLATYSIFTMDWDSGEDVEIITNGKSGFKAQKGGFVYPHGSFGNEGNCSFWWTASTEEGKNIVVDIGNCSQDLGGGNDSYTLNYGFALRGIKK